VIHVRTGPQLWTPLYRIQQFSRRQPHPSRSLTISLQRRRRSQCRCPSAHTDAH
jgi:hypothetical protein